MVTKITRRQMLHTAAAGPFVVGFGKFATAATKTVKIGLVAPQTGSLAIFSEQIPWTVEQIRKATDDKIIIGGTTYRLEIVLRDSQSSPNRAAEVAKKLILRDKVDLMTAFATPETVNPVADQCELAGIPCLSNDAPLEPYFFGRGGDPKKGFEWTYHFFFSATNLADFISRHGIRYRPTRSSAHCGRTTTTVKHSLRSSPRSPRRRATKSSTRAASICRPATTMRRFRHSKGQTSRSSPACCRHRNIPPSPAPLRSKIPSRRSCQSPRPLNFRRPSIRWANVRRACRLRCGGHRPTPTNRGLTGQTSQQLADGYEAASGKQWSMPLGFRHSLFEVALDVLKRTKDINHRRRSATH